MKSVSDSSVYEWSEWFVTFGIMCQFGTTIVILYASLERKNIFNSFTAHQTMNKERKLESRDIMASETAHDVIGPCTLTQATAAQWPHRLSRCWQYLSYKVVPIMKENNWWEHNENRLVFREPLPVRPSRFIYYSMLCLLMLCLGCTIKQL